MEKIGNVILDKTFYPGEDLYSDGAVEEELLQIAEEYREEAWNRVIAERKSWPVLYHFSHIRENIVNWIPFTGEEEVLEIGSGCGAITGALCRRAKHVTAIDLSGKRSRINALKHREYDNLEILVGNFQEIEKHLPKKYDYITLIGVFEYGESYIDSENPYVDFLKIIASHLKPDGRIVIAIENRFGLKYWAGCTEDHFGVLYEGLEGYPKSTGVKTFTKKELGGILEEAGGFRTSWYYPFPDYKFPKMIFSDKRLPGAGELGATEFNYDRLRLQTFQESPVFDALVENDLFPEFSNSFLLILEKEEKQAAERREMIYARFSNERAPRFSAMTAIFQEGERRTVERVPLSGKAAAHVERLPEIREILEQAYRQEELLVNRCEQRGDRVLCEYLEGPTLEHLLDQELERGDLDALEEQFFAFAEKVRRIHAVEVFRLTGAFREVFGEVSLPEGLLCGPASNVDLIPGNVLCSGDGMHAVDYEWTFPFPVPGNYILYRAAHYYLMADPKRESLRGRGWMEKLGLSPEEQACYAQMERSFQRYISGDRVPMREMYADISPGKVSAETCYRMRAEAIKLRTLQAFFGETSEFSEERSSFHVMNSGRITIPLPEGTGYLRLDPGERRGMLRLGKMTVTETGTEIFYRHNGVLMEDGALCFFRDPQILAGPLPEETGSVTLEIEDLTSGYDEEEIILTAEDRLRTLQQKYQEKERELRELQDRLIQKEQLIREMENTKVWKAYRKLKRQ